MEFSEVTIIAVVPTKAAMAPIEKVCFLFIYDKLVPSKYIPSNFFIENFEAS